MPTIKLKKATADYIAEKEREKEKEKDTKTKDKSKSVDKTPHKTELKKLDGEVLFEKRKRVLPVAEQTLHDWVDGHLESKSGVRLSQPRLYEFYGTSCLEDNKPVVEIGAFSKILKDKFGKEFAFKETSPLKDLLKETRIDKIKKRVYGEAGKKKMIDVIQEVLIGLGNPNAGVRFHRLLSAIAEKYPGLHIGIRPKLLLHHIENDFYHKKVALVKGVGRCGYYRAPGHEETITEDEEKENENEDGKAVENGEGETSSKKGKRKKSKEEGTEDEGEEENEEDAADDKDGTKKKKRRKSGSFFKPIAPEDIDHSNPKHIEETFPLAITYCSEPKKSTFARMKKYVEQYYPEVDVERKLRPALEKGLELGIWEQVNGSYLLNIEEFDPNLKDSVDDVICAAIIATTEPKIASARAIKQYVQDYHPEFQVDDIHPNKFRFALEKAVQKAIMKQISGLGATGSYQLSIPFTPSPNLLAGDEDVANDENYVVRPTKSGRSVHKPRQQVRAPPKERKPDVKRTEKKLVKKVAAGIVKKVKKTPKGKKRGRKPVEVEDDDDEEEDDEVEEEEEEAVEEVPKKRVTPAKRGKKSPKKTPAKSPTKSPAKGPAKSPAKTKGRKSKTAEDEVEETRPLKKRSRSIPKAKQVEKISRTSRGKSLSSYKENVESDIDESDAELDEPASKKSKSRR